MFDKGATGGVTGKDLARRFGGTGKPLSSEGIKTFLENPQTELALAVFCYSGPSVWGPEHHTLLVLSSLDDVDKVKKMGLGTFSYFLIKRDRIRAETRPATYDYAIPGVEETVG